MFKIEFFRISGLEPPGLSIAKFRISQSASAAKAVFVPNKQKAITDKTKTLLAILQTLSSVYDSELNKF